jgi:hypothetical protein
MSTVNIEKMLEETNDNLQEADGNVISTSTESTHLKTL